MLWWPWANMLPIALRMTMAKTEMTILQACVDQTVWTCNLTNEFPRTMSMR